MTLAPDRPRQRFALPIALLSFARTPKTDAPAPKLVKLLHGRG